MKKFRRMSKKGLTLVELVVTVAILGIVSTMGVGIVANSITNYSKASVTSNEHEASLEIEAYIVDAARRAIGVKTLSSSDTVPEEDTSACYMYFDSDGYLVTLSSFVDTPGEEPVILKDKYKGVKSVTIDIRKQKLEKGDTTSEFRFVYVEYTIELERGYVLTGTTVMGNVPHDYAMDSIDEDSFYDCNQSVALTRGSDTIYVFKQ